MDIILLAAGVGKRAKLNYPKQFMRLGGRPLFILAVELLYPLKGTDQLILSVIPGQEQYFETILSDYGFFDCLCVPGGETRQESVYNGLRHCRSERVMIHETVRPFVSGALLSRLIKAEGAAVVPCVPCVPTVFYKDRFMERSHVLCVQLPQIFQTELLQQAHESGIGKNYTDDSSLLFYELGIMPEIIEGEDENIKITTPLDIQIAEVIYHETDSNHRR